MVVENIYNKEGREHMKSRKDRKEMVDLVTGMT